MNERDFPKGVAPSETDPTGLSDSVGVPIGQIVYKGNYEWQAVVREMGEMPAITDQLFAEGWTLSYYATIGKQSDSPVVISGRKGIDIRFLMCAIFCRPVKGNGAA